jgi:hypothetical protein
VKYFPRRRPSPALLISCIALFVSLSGVSYGVATGFIDSREIKNNSITHRDVRNNTLRTFDIRNNEVRGFDIRNSSIQGKDVAFNTLTGNDVSESSLGEVPRATAAGTATSAGAVAGLVLVPTRTLTEGSPAVTLAVRGPLTISAACEADGTTTEAKLRVQTTEAGAAAVGGTSTPSADVTTANNPVIAPADGPVSVVEVADAAAGTRTIGAATVLASAPSGRGVTGLLGLQADAAGAGSCVVYGQVAEGLSSAS